MFLNKLLNLFKSFVFITLPFFIILVTIFEIFFRFGVPASNYPTRFFDEDLKLLRYNNTLSSKGTTTLGPFSKERYEWSINNFGWNSSIDYSVEKKKKRRIAIVGDSYVEAFQVNCYDHFSRKLEDKLDDQSEIYSFGISGSPLSQYLHMVRYIEKTFNPDIYIITVVHNDFNESLSHHTKRSSYLSLNIDKENNVSEVIPRKDPISKFSFIKKSAFARYLLYNLKVRESFRSIFDSNKGKNVNSNVYLEQLESDKIQIVVDYILNELKKEVKNKQVVFIMDGPRGDIYEGNYLNSNLLFLENILSKTCEDYKFDFLSLSSLFDSEYNKDQIKFNSQFDAHWNEYAHDLISVHLSEHFSTSAKYDIYDKSQ